MADFDVKRLAVPTVCLLIVFLAYPSQVLFQYLEPGPLSKAQVVIFNCLVLCIWICYARACQTDPGHLPLTWKPPQSDNVRSRWCRKCEANKPPRAHHCKTCQRCIPKMDHHCPWTNNCVSHFTFPHFIRFLFYAVASMIYLEYLIYLRGEVLWRNRKLPSYLGPSASQLVLLFILATTNSITLFMLLVMLVRTMWGLGGNVTTIESWEIARHERLVRRSRVFGGYLDGPDGVKVQIEKQEFPFDIGIWPNIKQGMDTANILAWFWPFATTPASDGLEFESNGFEEPSKSWPPPDPDRIPRVHRPLDPSQAFVYRQTAQSEHDDILAFKKRQQEDLTRQEDLRRQQDNSGIVRRKPFNQRYSDGGSMDKNIVEMLAGDSEADLDSDSGEEGWRNPDGDRLGDYGVDEEAEFYDEDDIPLSELLHRRNRSSYNEKKRAGS